MTTYKGLTLEEIIECFIDHNNEVDIKLVNILLYTYRSFCGALEIIKLIDKRLKYLNDEENEPGGDSSGNKGFTKAIIILFNSWLMVPFSYDFYELPDFPSLNHLLKNILEWPSTIAFIKSSNAFKSSFKALEEKISKALISFNAMDTSEQSDYRELPVDCQFRDAFIISKDDDAKNFLEFTPETIAVSLSYIDQKCFQKLRLPELIKHTQKLPAPSVTAIIDNYNKLHNTVKFIVKHPHLSKRRFGQYIMSGRNSPILFDNNLSGESTAVFSSPSVKHDLRHQVIEKWIYTAQVLYYLRSFSSLVAILTALNSTELKACINILIIKKATKALSIYQSLLKVIERYIYQNKEEVLNCENFSIISINYFSKQKNNLKNLKYHTSEIPYLGIYLRNMTFINEGFPDHVDNPIKIYTGSNSRPINIDKCRRQFDVMAQVRLFISSLNFNHIKEDELFSNWYFYVQIEVRKSKRYVSESDHTNTSIDLECLKSFVCTESCGDEDHQFLSISKCHSKSYLCMSHECLHSHERQRLETSKTTESNLIRNRSVGANLSTYTAGPKLATVILRSLRKPHEKIGIKHPSSERKHETVSNSATKSHERPSLMNIVRSTSSIDKKDERISINLENIRYKKMEISENDKTTDFISRVFAKFGKPTLSANNYNVVQILENGKEIVITVKANLFYALAEQTDYVIEVRPKDV